MKRLALIAIGGLVGAAITQQLDANTRTWTGRVFGVPYDFRMPTVTSLKAAMWDADGAFLLARPVFGLGWSVNLARLFSR